MDKRQMRKMIWGAIAQGLDDDSLKTVEEELRIVKALCFKFNDQPSRAVEKRWADCLHHVMINCFKHSD